MNDPVIFSVREDWISTFTRGTEENEANHRLIAEAPALYEALAEILGDYFDTRGHHPQCVLNDDETYENNPACDCKADKYREVLRRARGEA